MPQTAAPAPSAPDTLAKAIKAKFPGQYDGWDDADLETAIKAKYPGQYDAWPTTAAKTPAFQSAIDAKATGQTYNPQDAAAGERAGLKPTPAPARESGLSRFATQFYQNSVLAPIVGTIGGTTNVVQHPLDTMFGIKPLAGVAVNVLKAHWDQAVQAAQKTQEAIHGPTPGLSSAEALGHGLAAVLPLLGPAAANVGEHFGQGDIAGGAGGALGLLAPFAAKYGIEVAKTGSALPTTAKVTAANAGAADLLRRQATEQVSQQVLAPGNPKYRGVAEKIAPEVLSRKLEGSRLELRGLAENGMDDAGAKVDAAWNANPTPLPKAGLVQALDNRIGQFHVNGEVIPTAAGRVKALQALRDYINRQPGQISPDALRTIRDEFYETANKAKGYAQAGGNEQIADVGWAAREAGGIIRQNLAGAKPQLTAPNADFAFFKRLDEVLDPAMGRPKATNYVPSGVTGGMSTTGALIGEGLSNVPGFKALGAFIGSQLLPKLKAALASPEWQLASASKKMALADALASGNPGMINSALAKIMAISPAATSQPPKKE